MSNQTGLSLESKNETGPVECLGLLFESDEARREHFLELLAEQLKNPEFRAAPGFPKGSDEDILRLSDPPYYTACPNPFLEEYVRHHGRPFDPAEEYHREPLAVDVSEGKTDQLYRAHSYHTKVPHLAIVPSILHYTEPGDIVLDGFAGSGMTGVAAQWCGTAPKSYRTKLEEQWRSEGREPPKWGARRAIVGDLSPVASFIAANYNLPFDVEEFGTRAQELLDKVEEEVGWMYETRHTNGEVGRINYTVWSEVYSCPECAGEVVFVEEALDPETKKTKKDFPCPNCAASLTKKSLAKLYEAQLDAAQQVQIQMEKRVPVLIQYDFAGETFDKAPDHQDLELLTAVASSKLPLAFPVDRMMHADDSLEVWGDKWRAGTASFSHVHHIFLPRQIQSIAALWESACSENDARLRNMLYFFVEQAIWGMSLLARYTPTHYSQVNQYLSGVFYIGAQVVEAAPWYILDGKLQRLRKAFAPAPSVFNAVAVTTGDCAFTGLPESSIDYVFTDPPFGSNLAYSELNFVLESFHRLWTEVESEAVVSRSQGKGTHEYQELMRACFEEYCRVLKPGHWLTVVFSNSSNAIWRAIQEAMGTAGFIVADVRTLDKQTGSFNQVHGVSVKQDLVISAYKPSEQILQGYKLHTASETSVWAFLREHLANLPVFVGQAGTGEVIAERVAQMLLDRMIAFHVQRGLSVPLSAADFLQGLDQRFAERDGMYFLPEQVAEYDKKRMRVEELKQLELFVNDEASAVQWVRQQLQEKPRSLQDLTPEFLKELQAWAKHEQTVELRDILELNFLRYNGTGDVPSPIHAYLSSNFKDLRNLEKDEPQLRAKGKDRWYVPDPGKLVDLEKLREKTLLKEFEEYRESTKKLKQFRTEAVRAGFKTFYDDGDYQTIVDVGDRLPESVLQEDEKLLMYYDVASMRLGDG